MKLVDADLYTNLIPELESLIEAIDTHEIRKMQTIGERVSEIMDENLWFWDSPATTQKDFETAFKLVFRYVSSIPFSTFTSSADYEYHALHAATLFDNEYHSEEMSGRQANGWFDPHPSLSSAERNL